MNRDGHRLEPAFNFFAEESSVLLHPYSFVIPSSPTLVTSRSYHMRGFVSSWRIFSGILRATAMMAT